MGGVSVFSETVIQCHKFSWGGLMGLSIRVSDLDKLKDEIEHRCHRNLVPCDGLGKRAFILPADLTSGILIAITGE